MSKTPGKQLQLADQKVSMFIAQKPRKVFLGFSNFESSQKTFLL